MNKPFKILSSTAMVTALATTALVPAVSADTPSEVPAAATQLADAIFDDNGQLVSLDLGTYTQALAVGAVETKVTHVSAKDGSVYPISAYTQALAVEKTPAKALEMLYKAEKGIDASVVAGKIVDKQVVAENSPGVVKEGKLNIETVEEITADGVTTEVVKFQILDKEGKVDKTANDVVLEIGSTYGFLSQERLTIQNGEGEVILRSEFLAKETEAKISAQVIEAKDSHKELIGKLAGEKIIKFVPQGVDVGEVTVKQVVGANSNQADRVTLFFDKEVSLADFYETNKETGALVLDSDKNPILLHGEKSDKTTTPVLRISNKKDFTDARDIKAVIINKDNPQAVDVILDKATYLTDNTDVYVEYNDIDNGKVTKTTDETFKLADARQASVTGLKVLDNKTIEVSFSEAIAQADFLIDAQFVEDDHFTTDYKDVEFQDGRFINERRDTVVIELTDGYDAWEKVKGYFKPGKHALEVSTIKDFAALTDEKNIGKTQVLEFEIKEDGEVAVATQEVHSPEQFKVEFDKPVEFKDVNGNKTTFDKVVKLQVWDEKVNNNQGGWVNVEHYAPTNMTQEDVLITEVNNGVYKLELKKDWTEIYDTEETKTNYYNDDFRLSLVKGSVLTVGNGNLNEETIHLPLTVINGKATPLATPDTTSPVIRDIVKAKDFDAKTNGKFIVEMSEPVKVKGLTPKDTETIGQTQKDLPNTLVEFQGKDKNGKVRTFLGKVEEFDNKWDTKIAVKWLDDNGETPQTVVDAGGETSWKIIVRSISDDVGNTAATVTKDFHLTKTIVPENEFRVAPTGGNAVGADGLGSTFAIEGKKGDTIRITYTDAVAVTGLGSATNVKNYTLNGKDLPTQASIAVEPAVKGKDNKVVSQTVVIKLPENTLKDTNVITLAKQIQSKDGKQLAYDKTFTFKMGGLDTVIKEAKELNKKLDNNTLADEIKKAEAVLADEKATAKQQEEAAKKLKEAMEIAKEEAARAAAAKDLEELIKENPATNFEQEDKAKEALDAAKKVLNDPKSTAEDLNKAKDKLEAELEKLDPVVTEIKLVEIPGYYYNDNIQDDDHIRTGFDKDQLPKVLAAADNDEIFLVLEDGTKYPVFAEVRGSLIFKIDTTDPKMNDVVRASTIKYIPKEQSK